MKRGLVVDVRESAACGSPTPGVTTYVAKQIVPRPRNSTGGPPLLVEDVRLQQ